jgi:hypothetical protein
MFNLTMNLLDSYRTVLRQCFGDLLYYNEGYLTFSFYNFIETIDAALEVSGKHANNHWQSQLLKHRFGHRSQNYFFCNSAVIVWQLLGHLYRAC